MFRNSGKKITVVAKVLFWLNLLLALTAAVIAVCYTYSGFGVEMALMAALAAAAIGICYMLLVYVGLLALHAFGELTQSNVEIRRILAENRRGQERPAYVPPTPAPERVSPVPERGSAAWETAAEEPFPDFSDADFRPPLRPVPAPPPAPAPVERPQEPAARPAPFGMVYCRRCGAKHEPGVAKCRYCGTPLY